MNFAVILAAREAAVGLFSPLLVEFYFVMAMWAGAISL